MTIDERIEALVQSVELLSLDARQHGDNIRALIEAARQDGENIRGLARIAENHEHRLEALEGNSGEEN